MGKKPAPKIASALLCNVVNVGASGKIECKDIFTSFLAWGFPTSIRKWNAIITAYNMPIGSNTISVSIGFGRGKRKSLANVDFERNKPNLGNILSVSLQHQFEKEGIYTLSFNLIESTCSFKIPINVIAEKWPSFNKKDIETLKKNPSIPGSIRTNLICSDCSRPYVFEEVINPEISLADGVLNFPEDGAFECESCGRILFLKDIQGQIRNSIKNAIRATRKGEK